MFYLLPPVPDLLAAALEAAAGGLILLLGWLPAADAGAPPAPPAAVAGAEVPALSPERRRELREETERAFGGHPGWDDLPEREKELFHRYVEDSKAAQLAGNAGAAWDAAAAYARAAAPGVLRSGTAKSAAKYYRSAGRADEAAALLDAVLADPPPDGRRLHFDWLRLLRAELAAEAVEGGGDAAAAAHLEPFRSPPKTLGTDFLALEYHARAAGVHLTAGDQERARLYYLAAAPPAENDAATANYLLHGRMLAGRMTMRRSGHLYDESLNFQLRLMAKRPAAVIAQDLQGAAHTARLAGQGDVADGLGDALLDRFPDDRLAPFELERRAKTAVHMGNREAAVRALRALNDHPKALERHREKAARQLRMLGERPDRSAPPAPEPDPIGTRPAAAPR